MIREALQHIVLALESTLRRDFDNDIEIFSAPVECEQNPCAHHDATYLAVQLVSFICFNIEYALFVPFNTCPTLNPDAIFIETFVSENRQKRG